MCLCFSLVSTKKSVERAADNGHRQLLGEWAIGVVDGLHI